MAGSLGTLLRQKRESLGLTLEKAGGLTHIHVKHLQAIESDDLSTIPSVPQARGFVRNYAGFLGVSPEEIAAHVGGTKPHPGEKPPRPAPQQKPSPAPTPPTQAQIPVSPSKARAPMTAPVVSRSAEYAKPRPGAAASRGRAWLRPDWILGGGVTLVILALLGWGGYQAVLSMTGATAPAITGQFIPLTVEPAGTASPEALFTGLSDTTPLDGTSTPADATEEQTPIVILSESEIAPGTAVFSALSPTAFPTPLGGVYTDVRIHIIVLQRAYLEVTVDGKPGNPLPGRVLPEETYDYIGKQSVTISTGNGAGIRVIFNGVDDGILGRFGELVTRTYTPTGMVLPTPTVTATPALKPSPTPTVVATR
jgi:cytoskeleton protein RodZ